MTATRMLETFYAYTEGVLAGQRGDVMGQEEGSYLAQMTGDLSIQDVASSAEMLRTSPTKR